jgi:hypothetical protein
MMTWPDRFLLLGLFLALAGWGYWRGWNDGVKDTERRWGGAVSRDEWDRKSR